MALGLAARGAFLSFLESVARAGNVEDFGAMHQPINEGDDAGCVGEDRVPFAEGLVGGENRGTLLITTSDHLEQQIGVTRVIG